MNDKELYDKVYEGGAIWTAETPPKELVELVESGKIKPCKVLDIGCGEGWYSIYLAKKGFEVTGVDISEIGIGMAKENAKKENVSINFIALDVFELDKVEEKFDFVFEWAIMHIFPYEKRKVYVDKVLNLLNPKGHYFSLCFNTDTEPKGERIRKIPMDSKVLPGENLYFSTLQELKELFNAFKIIEAKRVDMNVGKHHYGNYMLMEK